MLYEIVTSGINGLEIAWRIRLLKDCPNQTRAAIMRTSLRGILVEIWEKPGEAPVFSREYNAGPALDDVVRAFSQPDNNFVVRPYVVE